MMRYHPQYTEYEVSIDSKVVCLWFTKSSVSTAELNFELKPQVNDIRISSNWIYDVILPPIDRIWSNKMKYNPLFVCGFCLDDADTKNKMNTNAEKLKGTLKKQK
jgi:hypothetical protein